MPDVVCAAELVYFDSDNRGGENETDFEALLSVVAYGWGKVYEKKKQVTIFIYFLRPMICNIFTRFGETQPNLALTFGHLIQLVANGEEMYYERGKVILYVQRGMLCPERLEVPFKEEDSEVKYEASVGVEKLTIFRNARPIPTTYRKRVQYSKKNR